MLMLKSKEMREKRAKLIADSRNLLNGELTSEVRTQVEKIDTDITQLEKDIELYETQEKRERDAAAKGGASDSEIQTAATEEARKRTTEAEVRKYTAAFNVYLRDGFESLDAEQRKTLKQGYISEKEGRAQSVGTTTAGGFLVPQGFQAELERALKEFGGVRQIARVLTTGGGNPIPWPTVDDTGNSGEDSTENTAANGQDIVFGQKTLNAYKMDSGIVLVSTELFEDNAINLESEIGSILGERLGRRQNNKQTLGSGTGTFQGVVVGASAGKTFAATGAITSDELIDLQHAVDPAYRRSPKCAFMMNDDTKRLIRKLKDSNGRYILDITTLPGQLDTLLGKPVITNQDMALCATGNKTVLFGDFGKFIIRDVRGVVIRRLNERYAEADQVGFIGWYRGDSRLVVASTKALVYGVQA